MRIILIYVWLVVCLFSVAVCAEQYGELFPDAGYSLQGLWHFSADGTDSSGSGNTCSASGAALTQAGRFGAAYAFDGSYDHLDCGTDNSLSFAGDNTFSMCAWIYPAGWGDGNYGRILSRYDTSANGFSWYVAQTGFYSTNTACMEAFVLESGVVFFVASRNGSIALNAWQQVCFVSTGEAYILYVDAENVGEILATAAMGADTATFYVGNRYTLTRSFDGAIDEVALWDGVLSAVDIRELYRMQKGAYGLID